MNLLLQFKTNAPITFVTEKVCYVGLSVIIKIKTRTADMWKVAVICWTLNNKILNIDSVYFIKVTVFVPIAYFLTHKQLRAR